MLICYTSISAVLKQDFQDLHPKNLLAFWVTAVWLIQLSEKSLKFSQYQGSYQANITKVIRSFFACEKFP